MQSVSSRQPLGAGGAQYSSGDRTFLGLVKYRCQVHSGYFHGRCHWVHDNGWSSPWGRLISWWHQEIRWQWWHHLGLSIEQVVKTWRRVGGERAQENTKTGPRTGNFLHNSDPFMKSRSHIRQHSSSSARGKFKYNPSKWRPVATSQRFKEKQWTKHNSQYSSWFWGP